MVIYLSHVSFQKNSKQFRRLKFYYHYALTILIEDCGK